MDDFDTRARPWLRGKKSKKRSFDMTENMLEALEYIAQRRSMSLAGVVQDVLDQYLTNMVTHRRFGEDLKMPEVFDDVEEES